MRPSIDKGAAFAAATAPVSRGFLDKYAILILAVLLLAVVPLTLDIFRLGLAAK